MRFGRLIFLSQNRGDPLNAQQTSTRAASASQVQTMSLREYARNRTLHNAVRATLTGQLGSFLNTRTDFNAPENGNGYTPLQIALEILLKNPTSQGAWVMVTALIKNGADVNAIVVPQSCQTAMHILVTQRESVYVQYLRKKGGANGIKDHNGQTPFSLAIDHEDLDLILGLLALPENEVDPTLETDINIKGPAGQTALHIAVKKQNLTAISTLLHFKAKLLQNSNGKTPLDLALQLANSVNLEEAGIGDDMVTLLDPPPPYIKVIENPLASNNQLA
jgi:ankyrin repeat protein